MVDTAEAAILCPTGCFEHPFRVNAKFSSRDLRMLQRVGY